MEALARDGRKSFVRALEDALRTDVDPRPGGHLAVHSQAHRFEAPELVPGRPLGDEHRVGDEHPRRPLMGVEHPDRLARLDEEGLIAAEPLQLPHDRVERLP